MNVSTFFQMIYIISIDYPVALILAILSFILVRKYLVKNYIINITISFFIFIILLIILYPALNISYYKDFIGVINKGITNIFNSITTKILLHKS